MPDLERVCIWWELKDNGMGTMGRRNREQKNEEFIRRSIGVCKVAGGEREVVKD